MHRSAIKTPTGPQTTEWLLSKIDRSSGCCWLWTGPVNDSGYGYLYWPDSPFPQYTHILLFKMIRGIYRSGFELDHMCQVRSCCNPAHLDPVPPLINKRRIRRRPANKTIRCACMRPR